MWDFFLSPLFFRRHALPFLKGEPSFFLLLLFLAQRSDEAAPDPPAPPPPPEPPGPPAPPGLADRPGVPLPDPPPPPFFLDGLCRSSSRCSFRSWVGFVIKSRPRFPTQLLIGPDPIFPSFPVIIYLLPLLPLQGGAVLLQGQAGDEAFQNERGSIKLERSVLYCTLYGKQGR